MVDAMLVALDTVHLYDVRQIGGKAASLRRLVVDGFPVPPALCLTTSAFFEAMRPFHEQIASLSSGHDVRQLSEAHSVEAAIATLLDHLQVPEHIATAVRTALPSIAPNDTPLAVRSSATAEDRADASFAGQYATELNVRGEEAVLRAILTCWRSFYSARALAARAVAAQSPLEQGDDAMAVLIQQMVDAECAGVCFTVDPVHRTTNVVIDAAWGLGAGAVDGSVATDTIWVRRDDLGAVDDQRIVEKPDQIAFNPEGGVMPVPVAENRRRAACLPDAWRQRIVEYSLAAEFALGSPQDVEWAIADGRVWILQSRPVTALPPDLAFVHNFPVHWDNEADRRLAWRVEYDSRSRVPTPLEHDVRDAWWGAHTDIASMEGREWRPLRCVFNGRVYATGGKSDFHAGDGRIRKEASKRLIARLRGEGQTLWEFLAPEIREIAQFVGTFDAASADGPKLAEHLDNAFGAFRWRWLMHWRFAFGFDELGPFLSAFEAMTGLTGDEARDTSAHVLEGEETQLTRLIDGLYGLAQLARAEPELATLALETRRTHAETPPLSVYSGALNLAEPPLSAGALRERFKALPAATPFLDALDTFLAEFGDTMGMGFGSDSSILRPTWREDPVVVLALIVPYMDGLKEPPAGARARAQEARDARFEAMCASSANAEKVAELRRWLPFARKHATALENHNYDIDQMASGQLRTAIVHCARFLFDHGAIADPGDVFWLQRREIVEALCEPAPSSLVAKIADRKAEHDSWEALLSPTVIGVPEATLEPRPPLKDAVTPQTPSDSAKITGVGASAGRHRGRARIVPLGTVIPEVAPGEVLVARDAGPAWTPIFPTLGALVLDNGVMTQHAATTAREFGIPAVIRTNNATRRIPDGVSVIVDGDAGTVEVEE